MFENLTYLCYNNSKITVVGIRDFYYVFTTFDGINLPRFAPFQFICHIRVKQTLFDTLGKSGHIVASALISYYGFTTFQPIKILVSPAMFFDSLRLFTHYNIPLTIEPEIGANVPVAIWEITPTDELSLDRYEGYPTFYYKYNYTLDVTSLDKKKVEKLDCFAYVMRNDAPVGLPTLQYVQTCLEGYRAFGFDEKILINTVERMRKILWNRKK